MELLGLICLAVAAFLVYGSSWVAGFISNNNPDDRFKTELTIKVIGIIVAVISVLMIMDII